MQRIGYYFFRFFKFLFKITPFWLLYFFSDLVFFLFYKVLKYRRPIVYGNLKNSFPDKKEEEILQIEKKFYKNLAMITVESLKGLSMTPAQMRQRYVIKNKEVADKYFEQGKSVIVLAAHYANWEWAVDAVKVFKHHIIGFYKPLANKYIDKYISDMRSDEGVELAPIENTRFTFQKEREKPSMFVMIADQNPSNKERAIWVNFLGRETACLHGPEFYIKYTKMPVIYFNNQRVRRGFYTLEVIDLGEDLSLLPDGEMTEKYMKILEKIILQNPANWLWSHKRWKHKR
jgi:KDO2-lipid IV(A) lauroyltransferase